MNTAIFRHAQRRIVANYFSQEMREISNKIFFDFFIKKSEI